MLDEVVVTRCSSPRALDPDELAAVAATCSAPTGSRSCPPAPTRSTDAVTLAEESAAELGGAGVLVTGSVVTAGEARALLRGRGVA